MSRVGFVRVLKSHYINCHSQPARNLFGAIAHAVIAQVWNEEKYEILRDSSFEPLHCVSIFAFFHIRFGQSVEVVWCGAKISESPDESCLRWAVLFCCMVLLSANRK